MHSLITLNTIHSYVCRLQGEFVGVGFEAMRSKEIILQLFCNHFEQAVTIKSRQWKTKVALLKELARKV